MKAVPSFISRILLALFAGIAIQSQAVDLTFNTQEFAPFNYSEEGVVKGPAREVIDLVCQEIDVTCTFRSLPWIRAQSEVRKGLVNGMFVIGWNEKRAAWVAFTPPLLQTEYGFFVHRSNQGDFSSIQDFKGYTVGVFGPSNTSYSLEEIARQVEGMTLDVTTDDIAAFKKLNAGRLDAVFSNRDVGLAMVERLGLTDVKYAFKQRELNYYIGFNKESTDAALVERFNEAFTRLYDTGVIPEILKKHEMSPVY